MDRLQFFALLAPALGSVLLVILSWINANARASRLEVGQDQTRAEIERVRSELRGEVAGARAEIAQVRSELRAELKSEIGGVRSEITQLRGEVSSLRDLVYREMVSLHERIANVEAKNP